MINFNLNFLLLPMQVIQVTMLPMVMVLDQVDLIQLEVLLQLTSGLTAEIPLDLVLLVQELVLMMNLIKK